MIIAGLRVTTNGRLRLDPGQGEVGFRREFDLNRVTGSNGAAAGHDAHHTGELLN